jgi:hypothetical protein
MAASDSFDTAFIERVKRRLFSLYCDIDLQLSYFSSCDGQRSNSMSPVARMLRFSGLTSLCLCAVSLASGIDSLPSR